MKAQDYADEYIPQIKAIKDDEELDKLCYEIVLSFYSECVNLLKIRNVKFDTGLMSILKEQNQKWNKFVKLVDTAGFPGLFIIDGFSAFTKQMLKSR